MEFRRLHNRGYRIFNIIGKIALGLFAFICVYPFLLIMIGSFTENELVIKEGYSLWPAQWSVKAYESVFKSPDTMINAYKVTLITTVAGTIIGTFVTALTGYALSRPYFQTRNGFSFMFYFTTLFSGGLIPWYILMTQYLQLKDTYWAIIIPNLLNTYNIILMRSFIKSSVPLELVESAKIDGAGEFRIFFKIVIALSTPALATIALFLALGIWNDWYLCMLFINEKEMYNLQYYLYNLMNSIKAQRDILERGGTAVSATLDIPSETMKLAMAVVATGPIVLVYPFVQRYFVKGLTIGAVKG